MAMPAWRGGVIAASFVVALMLTAMPLPSWGVPWRPAWVAMVLIYWAMALPNRVGMFTGFMLGLLVDVIDVNQSAVLGQHALCLGVITYVVVVNHRRLRVFPLGQQAVVIGSLLLGYMALNGIIMTVVGQPPNPWRLGLPALTSALLWPWLFVILRDLRRRAHLS